MSKFTSCEECVVDYRSLEDRCFHCIHNEAVKKDNFIPKKQELKVIDLTPCILSQIDMEFWDALDYKVDFNFKIIGKLSGSVINSEHGLYFSNSDYINFKNCRVRENHWHIWCGGNNCPIPDGLKFEVLFRSGVVAQYTKGKHCLNWRHSIGACASDIIGFKVTGVAEGWRYEHED